LAAGATGWAVAHPINVARETYGHVDKPCPCAITAESYLAHRWQRARNFDHGILRASRADGNMRAMPTKSKKAVKTKRTPKGKKAPAKKKVVAKKAVKKAGAKKKAASKSAMKSARAGSMRGCCC
jgi:hypothetical protein